MARSRNIKPEAFKDERLADCTPLARWFWVGLSTVADREGRLEDRPRRIKAEVLPHDNCDADELLGELQKYGLISRYRVNGVALIQILEWHKTQSPHVKELPSTYPAQDKHGVSTEPAPDQHCVSTEPAPDQHCVSTERAALIPDSGFLISDTREERVSPSTKPPQLKISKETKGTRFPKDLPLPDDWRAYAQRKRPDLDVQVVYDKFQRDYSSRVGGASQRSNWFPVWQTWIDNEHVKRGSATPPAVTVLPPPVVPPAVQLTPEQREKNKALIRALVKDNRSKLADQKLVQAPSNQTH